MARRKTTRLEKDLMNDCQMFLQQNKDLRRDCAMLVRNMEELRAERDNAVLLYNALSETLNTYAAAQISSRVSGLWQASKPKAN